MKLRRIHAVRTSLGVACVSAGCASASSPPSATATLSPAGAHPAGSPAEVASASPSKDASAVSSAAASISDATLLRPVTDQSPYAVARLRLPDYGYELVVAVERASDPDRWPELALALVRDGAIGSRTNGFAS